MLTELALRTIDIYRGRFDDEPEHMAWAPGRMEILGNHTDYNDGFVLSVALELGISAAVAAMPGTPARVEIWSETFRESARATIEEASRAIGAWSDYPVGVLKMILDSGGPLGGLKMAIHSDLPIGSGVSSSAALELCTAEAVYALYGGRPADPMVQARLCQKAEVEFVGVPCGILDQFSSLFGMRDHALFLDCRSLEYDRRPFGGDDIAVVIADTGVKHELVDGQYERLRNHCERAAEQLTGILGRPVGKLREVELEEFLQAAGKLEAEDRRRAEHVIRENRRVLEGLDALRAGRVEDLGRLMVASHESSRDLFGNSCVELDFLIEEAGNLDGFLGGKLSGGGFGGSTVNMVQKAKSREFVERLESAYQIKFRSPLRTFITRAGNGATCQRLV